MSMCNVITKTSLSANPSSRVTSPLLATLHTRTGIQKGATMKKHGFARRGGKIIPEYRAWCHMRDRCNRPKCQGYKNWGGRGILVCDRWNSFANFLADMGFKPGLKYTLERIDNDGNYEPENCRWATYSEQHRNKRTTRILSFGGTALPLKDWASKLGINESTLSKRINHYGWSIERALKS